MRGPPFARILAPAAERFVDREEGLGAVLGAAGRLERRQELMDERRAGKGNPACAGGPQDDREVLLLVLDREGGLEIAVDHLLSEHLERPGVRRARGERLVERRQGQARLRGEGESLRDSHEVVRHENLVCRLAELAGARGPERREAAAHRLEHGPRLLERRDVSADEERESSLDRPFLSARHRSVQEGEALFQKPRRDRARGFWKRASPSWTLRCRADRKGRARELSRFSSAETSRRSRRRGPCSRRWAVASRRSGPRAPASSARRQTRSSWRTTSWESRRLSPSPRRRACP